jgi:hypothetical protein
MPLGSPSIVGPLTPCCERVRVQGQFSGSRVRVFVDGDPNPVGDLTVPWSDFEIPVDHTRLVVGKKLSASQELGGAISPKSPKGVSIQPVAFGTVTFVKPPHVCGRSVLLNVQADPKNWCGSRLAHRTLARVNPARHREHRGTLCRVDFDTNQRVTAGAPLQAFQFICTSGSSQTTSSGLPLIPPTVPVRQYASRRTRSDRRRRSLIG